MRELSPAERCRRNNWRVGSKLKAKNSYQESMDEHWKITAIGEYEVLGKKIDLPPKTTSGEEIINFCDPEFTWRRCS